MAGSSAAHGSFELYIGPSNVGLRTPSCCMQLHVVCSAQQYFYSNQSYVAAR